MPVREGGREVSLACDKTSLILAAETEAETDRERERSEKAKQLRRSNSTK